MTFINRVLDFEKVQFSIKGHQTTRNSVIIIYAEKGVGKSDFVKQILDNHCIDSIPVKIKHTTGNSKVPDGYLIRKLDEYLENICDSYNFDSKVKRVKLKNIDKENGRVILKVGGLLSWFVSIATDFWDSYRNKQDSMLHSSDFHYITTAKEHIIDVFNKRNFWVDIEDTHLLDLTSIEFLSTLMSETSKNVFFIEITSTDSENMVSDWCDHFIKEGFKPKLIELEGLSEDDILKVASSVNSECDLEKISLKYTEYNGNLKKVRIDAMKNDIKIDTEGIKSALSDLEDNSLLYLSIIANYKDQLAKHTLFEIIEVSNEHTGFKYSEYRIIQTLNEVSTEILCQNNGLLYICHNSISDTLLDDPEFNTMNLMAYNILSKYYLKDLELFKRGSSNYCKILEKLLNLYAKYEVERLIGQIDNIKMLALAQINTKSAESFLDSLSSSIDNQDISETINFALIDAYYSIGKYNKADILIPANFLPNRYYLFMKAFILYRQGNYEECYQLINETIYDFPLGSRDRLIASVIKLIQLIVLNKNTEKERLFIELIKNTDYSNYPEFGYVLRLTEESDSLDSKLHIEQSIMHFEHHSKHDESARSQIVLGVLLSLQGQIEEGKSHLVKAKYALQYNRIESYNILNNLAVISMLQNNDNPSTLDDFLLAETLTQNEYDLFLIRNNILAYSIKNVNIELSNKYYEVLSRNIEKFSKNSVKCDIFYNCAKYHEMLGQLNQSKQYIDKLNAIVHTLDKLRQDYWETRLCSSNSGEHLTLYKALLNQDCHLSFSTNWWFSISRSYFEHYEEGTPAFHHM